MTTLSLSQTPSSLHPIARKLMDAGWGNVGTYKISFSQLGAAGLSLADLEILLGTTVAAGGESRPIVNVLSPLNPDSDISFKVTFDLGV